MIQVIPNKGEQWDMVILNIASIQASMKGSSVQASMKGSSMCTIWYCKARGNDHH